jgi:hypothetical protein
MGRLKSISKYRPSIFQTSLDFSSARESMTLAVEHPYESAFLRALMLILLVLCAGYLYFVGASVLNIIARKEAGTETTRLQSAIAVMEQEYFALSHSVDESIATSIGLTNLRDTQYVYRPGTAVAATIPGNGI